MPFGLGFFATAGAGGAAGSFDLLETQVLTGSAASVTFSSLSTYASTYQHLQIRYVAKSDRSSGDGNDAMIMTLNGDTGANYNSHNLIGDGAVNSGFETYQNAMEYTYIAGTGGNITGGFGSGVMDFLDAFETTKFKTRRTLYNNSLGGSYKAVGLSSAMWRNTAAISSITFDQRYGSNFVTGSRFSLYGIKAA